MLTLSFDSFEWQRKLFDYPLAAMLVLRSFYADVC
jgi:hypothetical protein